MSERCRYGVWGWCEDTRGLDRWLVDYGDTCEWVFADCQLGEADSSGTASGWRSSEASGATGTGGQLGSGTTTADTSTRSGIERRT